MGITNEKLIEIINNDPLNLLQISNIEETSIKSSATDQRVINKFAEIVSFYEDNSRLPSINGDVEEFTLAARLDAMRSNPKNVKLLSKYDFYDLLSLSSSKSLTVDDIINDDPLNLLQDADIDQTVFKIEHIKNSNRLRPDNIARRNICNDFESYEPIFQKIHDELRVGKRRLKQYEESDLRQGGFYVLKGILLFLEESKTDQKTYNYDSGKRNREDGRTRCIFDNGTESNMLFRSLGKALLKDGYTVTDIINDSTEVQIDDYDKQNGYIYVLKSLSSNPQVRSIKNLYKIGRCSGDITDRIKNAKKEPTYLMSDVKVELAIRCYNLDVDTLEDAIHRFFGKVNIAFEVPDENGIVHHPKEWFNVPLNVIEEAIRLIVDGKADNYVYNESMQILVEKAGVE